MLLRRQGGSPLRGDRAENQRRHPLRVGRGEQEPTDLGRWRPRSLAAAPDRVEHRAQVVHLLLEVRRRSVDYDEVDRPLAQHPIGDTRIPLRA